MLLKKVKNNNNINNNNKIISKQILYTNLAQATKGYQVLIKVKNDSSSRVNTWTVKVNKKDVKIDSSWCVNIAEEDNYYVITPMSWNSSIEPGASVDFGIQGNGSIGSTVEVTVQ